MVLIIFKSFYVVISDNRDLKKEEEEKKSTPTDPVTLFSHHPK